MAVSNEILVGGHYYLPYWVVQEYIDHPDDPFIFCELITITQSDIPDDDIYNMDICSIKVGSHLLHGIPSNYLIPRDKLVRWAEHFSSWLLDFAKRQELC